MNGAALHPTLRHPIGAGAAPPRRIDSLVGWFGAGLVAACALTATAGAYWLKPREDALITSALRVRVADAELTLPAAWLRSAHAAAVERLDLAIPLPALVEAGAQEDGPVFVTLSRPNG